MINHDVTNRYSGRQVQQLLEVFLRRSVVGLCICLLLAGNSACAFSKPQETFLLYPKGQTSPAAIELGKQVITQRLNWLEFKSIRVESNGKEIRVTFKSPKVYDSDALAQVFQVGLIEWVDTGPVPYNRGDAIDQGHVQLVILSWKDLKGKSDLVYDPDQKTRTLEFFADSLDVARSMTMEKFNSANPGLHNLCLVRDGIVFSCSEITITLPISEQRCSPNCVLSGKADIPIPIDYDLAQVYVLASQMQSGPLPIKFSVIRK
jgi:hypothetical protein